MTTRKFQEGAEQEERQAFLQYLAEKTGAQNQQELEKILQQLGKEGIQKAYAAFQQERQARKARFGAKLDYIRSLRGLCPRGMRTEYYKAGGKVCKKCVEAGKDPVESFKSGRKCAAGRKAGKWAPKKEAK